jgi:hypothetical protein
MRISEDRYRGELQRIEIGLRFLHHEARTQTIRVWTGLSNDRIRNLYRSYVQYAPYHVPRHRGKSPQQISYFTRSVRMQEETATLARMLSLIGAIPPQPGMERVVTLPNLTRGRLVCNAFEIYKAQFPSGQISFEHAIFLTTSLIRADQLVLGNCMDCGGLLVIEQLSMRLKRCIHCARYSKRL